jgi:hypothetical protein
VLISWNDKKNQIGNLYRSFGILLPIPHCTFLPPFFRIGLGLILYRKLYNILHLYLPQ